MFSSSREYTFYGNSAPENAGKTHVKTIEDSLKELERFFGAETRSKCATANSISLETGSASSMQTHGSTADSDNLSVSSATSIIAQRNVATTTTVRDQNQTCLSQNLQITVPSESRFFVIKSNSPEHIATSIQNGVWASTELGNRRLSQAFRDRGAGSQIFLLYSVNGSGCFCGLAEMVGDLRDAHQDFWTDKTRFKRIFSVQWIITQDIPNNKVRHLRNPLNGMKSVTQSRDTQEIPLIIGRSMVKIFENHINSGNGLPFSTKTTYY
ncbi:LAME_0D03224g1_1 [Lachancea meyersii CBS 8951]|uniref:LAME_0D03224g1_1 n=1 Tax=Lachancea meyersii CBS 8951 TaxID=1266667 RepID=A0A1G4J7P6_9SACH|nr:LAME_0D03224g1_1 [Lachancea meyersii CBS 8951]